ncbi:type 1 periplasmic binding fold superfamily protein [Lacinutrix sp.]|uniref:type 1 periplasmic binding fold superfamily protein n=1 Tax=Lacinutrix sp. TaxID=1937692 RepID=UPI0025B963F9|nr:type 1 periplasmic binding fold superfamily protein [Lacinutrix sp.]
MKNFKIITLALLVFISFTGCSDDDDVIPTPVNQEEVITTLTVTLTPLGGGTAVTLQTQDLDGDGPDAPEVTVSGNLTAGTTYNGVIVLLNETESPAENITEEVEEEADEHQFFYTIGSALDATTTYTSFDGNGNPLGIEFSLDTGVTSSGLLTFTLRHLPAKPNTGLANAGGETDIEATFNLVIQ